jgi:hypothetical protein
MYDIEMKVLYSYDKNMNSSQKLTSKIRINVFNSAGFCSVSSLGSTNSDSSQKNFFNSFLVIPALSIDHSCTLNLLE